MQLLLVVVATVAICGVVQAQQGVDPAYLRQYYQQLQQQQQHQQPSDGTPIYEQNSEQTQQYVSAGQQIRLKDTVSEQIRAQHQQQQQQQYVAPAVRDYLQQPQVGAAAAHWTQRQVTNLPRDLYLPLSPYSTRRSRSRASIASRRQLQRQHHHVACSPPTNPPPLRWSAKDNTSCSHSCPPRRRSNTMM